jgi:hypothetical protein
VSFSLSSLRVLSADEYVTVNYLCPCPVMLPCSIANTEESSITFPVLYPYPVFPSYLSSSPLLLSYLVLSHLLFSPSTLTTLRPLHKSLTLTIRLSICLSLVPSSILLLSSPSFPRSGCRYGHHHPVFDMVRNHNK